MNAPEKRSYGQILKSSALIGVSSMVDILFRIIRVKAIALLRVSDQREHLDRRIVNTWIGIVNTKIGHGEHPDRAS